MNKYKLVLLGVSLCIVLSACGNSELEKKDVKLIGAPKVDSKVDNPETNQVKEKITSSKSEEKDKVKENIDNTKNSTASINIDENKTSKTNESLQKKIAIPTIQYKLSNKIIVLDPGHASKGDLEKEPVAPNSKVLKYKQTGGAQGINTKTPEYKINMEVALKLKDYLEQAGFQVVMTKTDNNKTMSNIERAKVGNEANAALVIRIHADSAESSSAKGASMLIPSNNEYTKGVYKESKAFGQVIFGTLINEVGMKSRGVIERSDLTGFNWSKVPVVLVEMGFLSNSQEDKNLSDDGYQDKIAKAISKGVVLLSK